MSNTLADLLASIQIYEIDNAIRKHAYHVEDGTLPMLYADISAKFSALGDMMDINARTTPKFLTMPRKITRSSSPCSAGLPTKLKTGTPRFRMSAVPRVR